MVVVERCELGGSEVERRELVEDVVVERRKLVEEEERHELV